MIYNLDTTDYRTSYRALLQRLSAAVALLSAEEYERMERGGLIYAPRQVKEINREAGELIECMTMEMREARDEQ